MKIKDFQDAKNAMHFCASQELVQVLWEGRFGRRYRRNTPFLSEIFKENNFHDTKQIKIVVQKNERLSKKMNNINSNFKNKSIEEVKRKC